MDVFECVIVIVTVRPNPHDDVRGGSVHVVSHLLRRGRDHGGVVHKCQRHYVARTNEHAQDTCFLQPPTLQLVKDDQIHVLGSDTKGNTKKTEKQDIEPKEEKGNVDITEMCSTDDESGRWSEHKVER